MKGGQRHSSWLALWMLAFACQVQPPATHSPPAPPPREVIHRIRPAPIPVLASEPGAEVEGGSHVQLDDVMLSVESHFPLILAALEEYEIARGRMLQAQGGFDTRLGVKSKLGLEGYYENERADLLFEQPTQLWGTTFSGGYRYGDGDFASYDDEARTDEGGEFRVGMLVPLLQNGGIDPRRVALWQARLQEQQAEPIVTQKRLEATRKAADAYWKWLAWGRKRSIAQRLLELAEGRQEQVQILVEEGQLAAINLIENQRLIVERQSNRVRAERGLQEAAILLSLFWRDAQGRPRLAAEGTLPGDFPAAREPQATLVPGDTELAIEQRPEVRAVQIERERLSLDLSMARNQMLPLFDVGVFASQDVGDQSRMVDDRGPFELEALFKFSIPLQRSKPRGKIRELKAKLAKLERETVYLQDVVVNEVRDASSALTQAWKRLGLARQNAELALGLEEAERLALQEGQSDLFRVNLREQQTALAASAEVDVQREYFQALTDYRAVLGVPYDEVLGTAGP